MAIHAGDVSSTKGRAFEKKRGGAECDHAHQPIGVRARTRQQRAARMHTNLKPMRFVSLHHHSTFSYLDGFQLPEAHVRRATEINMGTMAMTEHGNNASHVKFEAACEKQGVKGIFGVEFYTGRVGKDATQRKYHLTVLAATAEGYRNLLHLISLSYSEGFHYEPTVSYDMLKRHKRGLIILSGCQGSLLFCSAVGGKLIAPDDASEQRAIKVAKRFARDFGDAYYVEVQAFPELESTRSFNEMAPRIAKACGRKLVGTFDCHYTAPEEAEIQKVLHNVRPGNKRTLEDQVRDWGYTVPLCPPPNDKAVYRRLVGTGLNRMQALEAIVSTEEIAQRCTVTLPKLEPLQFPLPKGWSDHTAYWRHLLREGWKYRGFDKLSRSDKRKAKAMLRKEVRIFEEKGFVNYMLVVQDFVVFAKDNNIAVGPGRGSAAASICAYLLRITEVNPMLFPTLVFERFIDITRDDPPDIDLDFPGLTRYKLREYGAAKYGPNNIVNVGTFTIYKSKLALDDVGKVHHVPPYKVSALKDLLIERSSGDLRASATIEDTVDQFEAAAEVLEEHPELRLSMDLEGNVKQFGVHAAGLVVKTGKGDMRDITAVIERVVDDRLIQVASMDKRDAERQGLLKLDFLALSTLDMLEHALDLLGMKLNDLYDIKLDDPEVLRGFREDDVTGVFQFDGRSARTVNSSVKPDNFMEVCDVIALCRPGPLHSGAAGQYIDAKHGVKAAVSLHPALDDITATTHGQIVYQEQILQVVTRIGGFNWTHASNIRRIISKKLGEQEFNREWGRFWEGASTLHKRSDYPSMDMTTGRGIWGYCTTSGAYAFNVAHCICYGMIGFWCMWLKRHHPAVFYASSLSKMPDKKPKGQKHDSTFRLGYHADLMRDAAKKGVAIMPPHPRHSGPSWTPTSKRTLRAGFEQVPKVGPGKAKTMAEYRDVNGYRRWGQFIDVPGVGSGTVDKLREFAKAEDPFGVLKLDRMLDKLRDEVTEHGLPRPTHTALEVPYDKGEDTEVVWMGIIVNRNLRDIFESHRSKTGEELDPKEVKRPELNELAIMDCYDGTEILRVRIDRFKYPRFRAAFWSAKVAHDVILVRGVKQGWRSAREITVNELWVIDPEG